MSTTRMPTKGWVDSKAHLQVAKEYFYSLRMVEAYHILRRFFDRLPFNPEKEHAEYIGIFSRILSELGKSSELCFYVTILEEWYRRTKNPVVGYPLAVIYRQLPDPRHEAARKIFEDVVAHPESGDLHVKAKMMLAHYYDWVKKDKLACRTLIESIQEPRDPSLRHLWLIWRAKILKDQERYDDAGLILDEVFKGLTIQSNWYGYFSGKVIQASLRLAQNRRPEALELVKEVRKHFAEKNLKTLKIELDDLERRIQEPAPLPEMRAILLDRKIYLSYRGKELLFEDRHPTTILLKWLIQKGRSSKATIISKAFGREYSPASNDKFLYHLVHQLRKKLASLGLPAETLERDGDGYSLEAKVLWEKEQ